jgi:hypothetical protein
VSASEIVGVSRVVAGYQTFEGVRYRIRVVETNRKRGLVGGTIEAAPDVVSAIYDFGEAAIELAGALGWFAFVVTNVVRGEITMMGRSRLTH